MTIEVVKPGLFSTFQDLGRSGFQHLGVPVSGAMDEVSHRVANLLAGNDEGEATLEITLLGPSLRFGRCSLVALCGADLSAVLVPADGQAERARPLPLATACVVEAGELLQFGKRRAGLRSYLAVRGGFGLPRVMGSCSTHVRGGIGGFEGRALRKGDRLPLPDAARFDGELAPPGNAAFDAAWRRLASLDAGAPIRPIRVTTGREQPHFAPEGLAAFLSTPYRVGAQSERMAYRLEGATLERRTSGDILSEAVAFGTVQVPPDGQPIVLMADRQSSGGYPRIAQVASVDLPRLAQVMPGESVRFEAVELAHAQHLLRQRAQHFTALRAALGDTRSPA
jgi:urea carboxylase